MNRVSPSGAQRRRLLFVAVLLLGSVGIASVFIWLLFENRALRGLRRARLAAVIPLRRGSGPSQTDVILAYEPPRPSAGSLLEGFRFGTDASLWRAGSRGLTTIANERGQSIAAAGGRFALAGRRSDGAEPPPIFVVVHRSRDGERIWEHLFPRGWDWALGFRIWAHRDLLLAGVARAGHRKAHLIAFDLARGTKRWEISVPRGTEAPQVVGRHLVLRSGPRLLIIRRRDGASSSVGDLAGLPFVLGGRLYAPLVEAASKRPVFAEIVLGEGPPRIRNRILLPAGCRAQEGLAVYGRRLLCALGAPSKPEIVALSLEDGRTLYRRPLPAGPGFRGMFHRWKRAGPSVSAWHQLTGRYVPLMLQKRGTADAKSAQKRLVLLDVETGTVRWKSRPLGATVIRFTGERILAQGPLTFLTIDLPKTSVGRSALLVIDGRTGVFPKTTYVRVRGPRTGRDFLGYPVKLRPWMLGDRRFFGFAGPWVWALDLEDLTIRGVGRADVQQQDATPDVEALLGPLPR